MISRPPKPEWFANSDYSYLPKLKVAGWYAELTRLYSMSVSHGLGLHAHDPSIVVMRKDDGTVDIAQIGGPFSPFIVSLNAPDAILHAQFTTWLQEVRKQIKPSVTKPGKYALNSEFDKATFLVWQDVGIVQLAGLLAWKQTLGAADRKHYPRSLLGEWIGRSTSKDVNTTERILKRALASIPALGAQLEHEMILGRGEGARESVAARISKDIAG